MGRLCRNAECHGEGSWLDETGCCSAYCRNVLLFGGISRDELERNPSPMKCNHISTRSGECVECGEKTMTEEIKSTMKKFWMVARVMNNRVGGGPTAMHASFEIAMNEAKRLAASFPESSFVVLESTHEAKTSQPPVVVNTIE